MKRRVGSAGFTVVEMMIVLAVTGALFVLIAVTISGRQRSNEFTQAINDIQSQLQQKISEVQAGYYPHTGSFTCSPGPVINSGGSLGQGEHGSCVYLGSAFQIAAGSPERIRVYTLVGNRSATDITAARPTPIPITLSDETVELKYGLEVARVRYAGGPSTTGTFAVMNAPLDTSTDSSGSTQLDVYGVRSPALGQADGALTAANLTSSNITANPSSGVEICINSGGTDHHGIITIGQSSRQLAVDLQIGAGLC